MVKHIVFLKLKPECSGQASSIQKKIEEMRSIPLVGKLECGVGSVHSDIHADLAIYSEFDSSMNLAAYLQSQKHLAVSAAVKDAFSEVRVIDYEV